MLINQVHDINYQLRHKNNWHEKIIRYFVAEFVNINISSKPIDF